MICSKLSALQVRPSGLNARSARVHGVPLTTPRVALSKCTARVACRTVAVIIPPNLFAGLMIPRPGSLFGMENEHDYKAEIHKEFPTWKQHSEMTSDHAYLVEGDFLQRRFRVQSTASGMTLMKAIQQEFYTPQSKGCQVRRETQSKFSLSCQEVRAVFSETKLEVVVDVKVPEDEAEMRAAKKNMQRVDLLGASKR